MLGGCNEHVQALIINKENEMLTVKPTEAKSIIAAAIKDNAIVPMIWGAPGIGKTAIAHQVTEDNKLNYIQVIAAERESPDFTGYYYRNGSKMEVSVPDIVESINASTVPTVLHMDEIPQAYPMIQNIVSRVVNERVLGTHKLRDDCIVIGSGNMPKHKAGTHTMPTHLKGRLCHVEMTADIDDFKNYAPSADISPLITAYLDWRPAHLSVFDADQYANPSPRTWHKTSKVLALSLAPFIERAMVAGYVGDGVSAEFFGYVKIYRGLPPIAEVFANPETVRIGNEAQIVCALASAVAHNATTSNMGTVKRILDRLSGPEFNKKEFCVASLKEMRARNSNLLKTKAGIELAVGFSNIIL